MRKILLNAALVLACITSIPVYANPDDSCDGEQTIFDAYAVKGGKHVGVCYIAGNIRYVYGKDSGKPDILLNVPKDKVKFTLSGNGDQSVTIPNGDYSYTVGESLRGGSSIQVWKQQKLITEIELSGETLENHIEKFSNTANVNDAITLNVSTKYSNVPAGRYYFWKYQLISNVDNLTINKITVNNGHCLINEKKRVFMTKAREHNMLDRLHNGGRNQISEDNEIPRTDWDLNTGGVYYFTVSSDSEYGKCRPREALIETNKGISTFRWKN
ncbi:hypothetical protein [Yersinia enterocolitica]|uniref:hypothetical protein n=1 Tax=Yersinia enterocolitica TaxID=630 RepID=UPI003F48931A